MKISYIKTPHCLAFIISCAISASLSFFIKADVFDDLFKNVDFEQLAKDMEKILGETEDGKEELPKMSPVPSKDITPGTTEKVTETKTSGPKKDRRTLFLDPDIKTVQLKNKTVTEPTKESRSALSSFIQEMDKNLKIFEKNIDANKKLSPQFKEKYLHEIRKKIDEIVVASELIDSKKIYQKIFLAPPTDASKRRGSTYGTLGDTSESTLSSASLSNSSTLSDLSAQKSISGFGGLQNSVKQLRQRYLALIDELNSLNEKLKVTEEEESKEEDKTILEELAGPQEDFLPVYTPLVPLTPKVRGVKPKVKTTPKKSGSVKNAAVQTGEQR